MRIILTIAIALTTFSITTESSYAFLYSNLPYNVPPRTLYNCEQAYIGHGYDHTKEVLCRRLWDTFTREQWVENFYFLSK